MGGIMTSRIAYNNPDAEGRLSLPYHYEILADRRRLEPLRRAIESVARGRRVLESGAGSGVLSLFAAKAGARQVYAVEKDPAIIKWIRENVRSCRLENVVRVIEEDARSLTLADVDGQKVDLIIAEHLSTWQVTESQISVMNHLNRQVAGEPAIRIPECAFNCVELANSQFRFEDAVDLRTYYFVFSGIRGPKVLSRPTLFQRIDFGELNETSINHAIRVKATGSGIVNSLQLTSPLRLLEGIDFQSSDSLMPPVVVPLAEDLQVEAGDVVKVHCKYSFETEWQLVSCEAAPAGSGADASPSYPLVPEPVSARL
jgi:predicted RNA methylase